MLQRANEPILLIMIAAANVNDSMNSTELSSSNISIDLDTCYIIMYLNQAEVYAVAESAAQSQCREFELRLSLYIESLDSRILFSAFILFSYLSYTPITVGVYCECRRTAGTSSWLIVNDVCYKSLDL